jgi:hypothetical protein
MSFVRKFSRAKGLATVVVCLALVLAAFAAIGPRASYGQTRKPSTPVEVVNTAAAPALVRNVDDPARNNFQTAALVSINQPDFATVVNMTFPAGKVFVIEFVSVHAQVPNGEKLLLTFFAGPIQHYFAPPFVGSDSTTDQLILSQPVRMYHDTNVPLAINATRFASNQGQVTGVISVSGYLIDP